MRKKLSLIVLAAAFSTCGGALSAADSDFGIWSEFGTKGKLSNVWNFKSDIELRRANNASDLNYVRWEFGPGIKINNKFNLQVMYRYNPQKKNNDWQAQHYLMLDPDLMLYSSAKWNLNFVGRFMVKLGDLGRGYFRPRFQVARKFNIGKTKTAWYASNEFFFQITELAGRDRYNQNWLTTGFKFSFNKTVDLGAFYRLRTDKPPLSDGWTKLHLLGTSLYFNF